MLTFIVRGVVLISLLTWYSAAVWKMIDNYFKDQFRAYLQEEYRRNPQMKFDIENTKSVDKEPAVGVLPTELSYVADTYGLDIIVDTADNCLRATGSGKPRNVVTGGTSESTDAGSIDKNAFPDRAEHGRSLESRKPPSGSDTHDDDRRPSAINQDGDHAEEAIKGSEVSDGSVLPASSTSVPHFGKSQVGKKSLGRSAASKIVRQTLQRKRIKKQRVNVILSKDTNFAGTRISSGDDDFSEFEEKEEESQKIFKEGILVSELPFKPEADIGGLDRVSAEEFCPLTLENEASCGEITTWP